MSIIIFLFILAALILSHELGHFIFAKIGKVKVEEFGLGFPPRIFGIKKGETVYSLNLIPFGGFVKIYGEDGEPSSKDAERKRSFAGQKIHVRALILTAGVIFNLLLAWPVLTTGYMVGAPVSIGNAGVSGAELTEKGIMVIQVQEKTPAETAGLKAGDYLLRLASKDNEILQVSDIKAVQDFISKHAGMEIRIDYQRGGKKFTTQTSLALKPEAGKGSLGIIMDRVGIIKLPFYKAAWEGLISTANLTTATAKALIVFFGDLFTKREMLGQVAGPIGIIGLVSGAAQTGLVFVLQLVALLTINLALINIIPFPALDGGRLLFLGIEFVRRKAVSQKTANIANNIGFAILILLMFAVTYQDVLRLVR